MSKLVVSAASVYPRSIPSWSIVSECVHEWGAADRARIPDGTACTSTSPQKDILRRKQRRQRSSKKSRRLRKIDRECRYNSEYLKMTLSRCRIYIFRDFRRWNSFENGCCRQEGFLQAKRYENWFWWNWLEQLDYCSKQFWCILLCWPMRICWDTGLFEDQNEVNQRSS